MKSTLWKVMVGISVSFLAITVQEYRDLTRLFPDAAWLPVSACGGWICHLPLFRYRWLTLYLTQQ